MQSTMTTDFLGSYDWPAEEGAHAAAYYLDCLNDGETQDWIHQRIIKDRAHWVKVFGNDAQGLADMAKFTETVNAAIAGKINAAM